MWAAKGKKLESFVLYGESRGELDRQVKATSRTYSASEMCGARYDMDGYSYEALLQSLRPSTRYYYTFGSYENEFLFFSLLFTSLHFSSLLFSSVLFSSLLFSSLLFSCCTRLNKNP